jgi:hypothetical protein
MKKLEKAARAVRIYYLATRASVGASQISASDPCVRPRIGVSNRIFSGLLSDAMRCLVSPRLVSPGFS